MDVLLRLEEAVQESAALGVLRTRPNSLSASTTSECIVVLTSQRSKLEKQVYRLIWPFHDRDVRKAIDELHQFRSIFADYIIADVSSVSSSTVQTNVLIAAHRSMSSIILRDTHAIKAGKSAQTPRTRLLLTTDSGRSGEDAITRLAAFSGEDIEGAAHCSPWDW